MVERRDGEVVGIWPESVELGGRVKRRADVLVRLCCLPGRAPGLAKVLEEVLPNADVDLQAARPGDRGPLEKWLSTRDLRPWHRAVVVLDDDHAYCWRSLDAAVAVALERAPALAQAAGRTIQVADNPDANGGPYLFHRWVWDVTHTDLVAAFAGVAVEAGAFVRLSQRLSVVAERLSEDERLSDDLIVSREARALGFVTVAVPVPPPVRLSVAALDPVSERGDGIGARYKRLVCADRWWARPQDSR